MTNRTLQLDSERADWGGGFRRAYDASSLIRQFRETERRELTGLSENEGL